jgi:diguanylate cyclase (GGDEF)-like protein
MGRTQGPGGHILDDGAHRFAIFAIGLGIVAIGFALPFLVPERHALLDAAVPLLCFASFIALSWFFSFSLFPRARLSISLDMTYMLTALAVLPPPLPLAVALCGGIGGALLRKFDPGGDREEFLAGAALNTGSLVLAACAGQWAARTLVPAWPVNEASWGAVGTIATLYAVYSLTNLAVMVTAVALKGDPVLPYVGGYLRYLPTLEVYAIPLALGLALLYAASGLGGFAPLGGTILFASALLKKLNRARSELSRALEQVQSRTRELKTVNTIGREISSSLDPQVVFARIAFHLTRILDAPYLILSLRQRGAIETYVEFVARDGRVQPRPERPLGEGFTHWVVEARRPLMLADLQAEKDSLPCAPVVLDPEVRAILAAPLPVEHGNEAIGVLCVQSPRVGAYGVEHVSVLTTVAQQAAVAIDNARNYQLATVDQLTHLYLRDFFKRKLQEEQARAQRYGSGFAVVMVDLDRFKQINDRLGHLAGDRYLQKVGSVVRDTMRAADIPCRWGGEEFAVLLPETDRDGARSIAERLQARIGALRMMIGDAVVQTTVSAGIACYPHDTEDGSLDLLLERADKALYAAKQAGRDRIVVVDELPPRPEKAA